MYTRDKDKRVTVRLNIEQFDFLQFSADLIGVTPSQFLRMVINSAMAQTKTKEDKGYENK